MSAAPALPGFPPAAASPPATGAGLASRGLRLRALGASDLPWLRALYASTRADELAPVPWPEAAKRAFLDQQFDLQHRHFVAHYAAADFLAIEHASEGPVGRYYLLRTAPAHLIVDISLLAAWRGTGVGGALIRASQADAASAGCGMRLQVARHNPRARRLYQRLGFRPATGGPDGGYEEMAWWPQAGGPGLS